MSLKANISRSDSTNETHGSILLAATLATVVAAIVIILTSGGDILLPFVVAVVVFYVAIGIRTVRPTHRVLIEFLGKYQRYGDPGFYWILTGFQKLYVINVTEMMVDAQPQEIITKDSLNAGVDAQVYFKVRTDEESVKASQYNVNDYKYQIVNLARTTLRNIIGNMNLKEANSERGKINEKLYEMLTEETKHWGIEIVRTELKEIEPPKDVQDAMNQVVVAENRKIAAVDFASAVETEADGKRRAAIKMADGEKQSKVLVAEGNAKAIELVNIAANTYFVGNAQILKKLETAQAAFEKNTKIIVPSDQNVVNLVGNLAGVPDTDASGGSD